MITLLVEKIIDDEICVTPSCNLPLCDEANWKSQNIKLLFWAKQSGHYQLKELTDYDNQIDSYYILNIRHNYDLTHNNVWEHIPESSKKIILEKKIPVMFWLPLECTSFITTNQWQRLIDLRDKAGFSSCKTVIFSICTYKTNWGNELKFDKIYCDNLYFVQSILFLAWYNTKQKIGNISKLQVLENQICKLEEHNLENKKYDFLCLNNQKRPNRTFLLQALYKDKNLWNNNIISSRHETDNVDIINTIFLNTSRYDRLSIDDQEFTKLLDKLTYGPSIGYYANLVNSLNVLESDLLDGRIIYKKIHDNDHLQKIIRHVKQEIPQSKFTTWMSQLILSWQKQVYEYRELDSKGTYFNDSWDKNWYYESWFSLVTECFCYNDEFYHESPMITEKIIKAIVNYHPFVIFGHSGSHNLLQSIGFKTFEKTFFNIPEDYTVGNTAFFERLYNLMIGLEKFRNMSLAEKKFKFNSIKNDLRHNHKLLVESDWFKVQHDKLLNIQLLPIPVNHFSIWGNT